MESLILTALGLGFILGIRHAFDADHVTAIATMAHTQRSVKRAAELGLLWGIGHTLSLLAIGFLVLLFKTALPENLAVLFELAAGTMLIIIGVTVLAQMAKMHSHQHRHGAMQHAHFHTHVSSKTHNHKHRPLLLGLVHGLAGSALVSILALSSMPSLSLGLLYIILFGIGSILGMMLITNIVLHLLHFFTLLGDQKLKMLHLISGLMSIAIGIGIVYRLVLI